MPCVSSRKRRDDRMRMWIAAMAAGVLLAGCGAAAPRPVTPQLLAHPVEDPNTIRPVALAYAWRLVDELSPPPGSRTVHLTKIQLAHGTVLIVVTAEVAWLPAKTPSEFLDPASFGSVTISAQPWLSHPTTRRFTSQADITRLTSIINAGVPAPSSVVASMSCAPVAIVYTLRFTPRTPAGPSVVVTLGACPHSYGITVNGKQQPSLWDNGKLRTAAGTLLGIRYPNGT
jgi:ligand-binding SRPBCC domain-containing protein